MGRILPLGRWRLRAASRLAVAGGRVVAVGDDSLDGLRGANTTVLDVRGDTVLPGFNDSHAHVVYSGLTSFGVRLGGTRSIAEIQRRLGEGRARLRPGEWLQGRGYSVDLLAEKRHPTRRELDAAAGGVPTFIDDRGGHARVANTAALAAAGVDASTPEPAGGGIGRDPDGQPDGRLLESAMRLVADRQPPPTLDRRRAAILRSLRLLSSRGVTSVGAAVNRGFADDLLAYQQLAASRSLRVRVNEFLSWELLDAATSLGLRSGFGSSWLRAGPIKVFVDGGAAGGAALSDGTGVWRTSPDELRGLLRRCTESGLQLAAHAIGDAAISAVLDAVENAGPQARTLRHRIEHFTIARPDLARRAAALNVVAVMQPLLASRREWLRRSMGPELAALAARHRMLKDAGVHVAFSSDLPVTEDPNPWHGIAAAVTDEMEPLDTLSALRAYTEGGAWSSFEESSKGSLEPGRFADFQVIPGNWRHDDPASWRRIRPALVVLGGRIVYRRKR